MANAMEYLRHAIEVNTENSVFPCRYYYDPGNRRADLTTMSLVTADVRSNWTTFATYRAL